MKQFQFFAWRGLKKELKKVFKYTFVLFYLMLPWTFQFPTSWKGFILEMKRLQMNEKVGLPEKIREWVVLGKWTNGCRRFRMCHNVCASFIMTKLHLIFSNVWSWMLVLLWKLSCHGGNYLCDWERIFFHVVLILKSPTTQLPTGDLKEDSLVQRQLPNKRRK